MLDSDNAGCFQARELPFYYLHARLWLLIALARLALDYPKQVAAFTEPLLAIVKGSKHVSFGTLRPRPS
jgi:hypothetical protein